MADDKQLTVAELLARNGEERGDAGEQDSSRRHRRSLEEGGVSVAELTGGLKKVEATPPESKHSDQPIDEPAPVIPAPKGATASRVERPAEPEHPERSAEQASEEKASSSWAREESASAPAEDDTAVFQRVDHAAEDNAAEPGASAPQSKDRGAGWESPLEAETGEMPVVDDHHVQAGASAQMAPGAQASQPQGSQSEAGEPEQYAAADRDGELERPVIDEDEEDGKLNPLAVILLAVLGVVIGVLVFLGFEALWARLSKAVVAILALAVTAAMVGVAHALRTDRDRMSMVLAGLVGLVITFGPLLIA